MSTFPAGPFCSDSLAIAQMTQSLRVLAGEMGVNSTQGDRYHHPERKGRTLRNTSVYGAGGGQRPARSKLGTGVQLEPKSKVKTEGLVKCIRHPRGVTEDVLLR